MQQNHWESFKNRKSLVLLQFKFQQMFLEWSGSRHVKIAISNAQKPKLRLKAKSKTTVIVGMGLRTWWQDYCSFAQFVARPVMVNKKKRRRKRGVEIGKNIIVKVVKTMGPCRAVRIGCERTSEQISQTSHSQFISSVHHRTKPKNAVKHLFLLLFSLLFSDLLLTN